MSDKLYAIKESTLSALGDAIRDKLPPYIYTNEIISNPREIILDTREMEVSQRNGNGQDCYMLPIDIRAELGGKCDLSSRFWAQVEYEIGASPVWTTSPYSFVFTFSKSPNPQDSVYTTVSVVYDTITEFIGSKGTAIPHNLTTDYHYMYATIRTKNYNVINDNSNYCRVKLKLYGYDNVLQMYIEDNIKPQYSPLEMRETITEDFIYKEPWIITDGANSFQGKPGAKVIELLGDKIRTKDLSGITQMFYQCPISEVPFELNFATSSVIPYNTLTNPFAYSNLTIPPKFNNVVMGDCSSLFSNMKYLREFPEGYFDNWDFSNFHSLAKSKTQIFSDCSSLRKIPQIILDNMWISYNSTNTNLIPYYQLFANCSSLDEIIDLNIAENAESTSELTNSSSLYMLIARCARLKNFTFKKNSDGTPKTIRWKNLTLDVSSVGYSTDSSTSGGILNYNSGITSSKAVTNDDTYQALKNDPDWYSANANYSRYNHDSAVRTIDSLPDTSAFGTNIIKFKGTAGALTDGGAINTLTEEEIAVATAKGWTVSLV